MPSILIVDDEEPIRVLLRKMLEETGHSIFLAAEASEARKRLEGQDIDLILCDVMMPGESCMVIPCAPLPVCNPVPICSSRENPG
jgi:CheY-like chemotaxis protein